jgi:hypothetical protein
MSDISALRHVHFLDIRNCRLTTDVSALVNCHTLHLDSRQKETLDTSTLVNVNIP